MTSPVTPGICPHELERKLAENKLEAFTEKPAPFWLADLSTVWNSPVGVPGFLILMLRKAKHDLG